MQHNNLYTFKFITIITLVASFLLALASTQLKELQEFNVELDRKKNILKCIGKDVALMKAEAIIVEYKSNISNIILNLNGSTVENITSENLESIQNKSTGQLNYFLDNVEYLPAYKSSSPEAFIIPISGKGLWSTLYGYFALENDLNTVMGITFYKHGETPGLGGEVEKKWFQNNFVGKKIFDQTGELVSIKVVKGKVNDVYSDDALNHGVDGISGATITSRGVSDFLKRDLLRYEAYMKNNRTN
ncbi:MAG: NADH:ubiquinone reductase (Na(+)-transporting) subunit C [Candidatus Marinimicrobia bacterium]|nr:NADH:ubiquinone reductase (Na(+)-transporting) subunit C [Candidatus Neomarinimicrobiota bacterium]